MQPKKRKQRALLMALTMILTITLQLLPSFSVQAEEDTDSERTIVYNASATYLNYYNKNTTYVWKNTMTGNGHFHILPYCVINDETTEYGAVYASESPFVLTEFYEATSEGLTDTSTSTTMNSYDGVSVDGYYRTTTTFLNMETESIISASFPNVITFYSSDEYLLWLDSLTFDSFDFSKDNYGTIEFDETTATYDATIPAPKMSVDNDLNYRFINDDANYMYEVRGRWRSIDDITLTTSGLTTLYTYYKTTVKCELLKWVSPIEERLTSDVGSFAKIGSDYFYNFLTMYPIEKRNVSYTNMLEKYDYWYEVPALDYIVKNFNDPLSAYNQVEVYVRYIVKNEDGSWSYGKWTHYFNNLLASGSTCKGYRDDLLGDTNTVHSFSDDGLFSDELEDLESLEDSRTDSDIVIDDNELDDSDLDFTKITKVLLSLYEQAKVVFSMYATVFSFLPIWVTNIISVSVVLICFIGIWKVIR